MPDDQKSPGKTPNLSKEFKEFSFDDAPAGAPSSESAKPAAPPPGPPEPVKLTKEDMNFVPYRGMDDMPTQGRRIPVTGPDDEDDEDFWAQKEYEERQIRAFDAAGSMFRHEHEITNALTILSNLEIQSVVAAGFLFQQYQGLPQQRRNDMVIAALALDAENFDDICGELTPETVGMVDEIHRLQDEPDVKARLMQAESLEPDSKRVLLAMTVADLEMSLHEMHDAGDPGMEKEELKQVADFICALAPGVDKGLRRHAIDAFNLVSTATDNGATIKEKPDGSLIVNAMPDIQVEIEPPATKPQPKSKAGSKPRRKPK